MAQFEMFDILPPELEEGRTEEGNEGEVKVKKPAIVQKEEDAAAAKVPPVILGPDGAPIKSSTSSTPPRVVTKQELEDPSQAAFCPPVEGMKGVQFQWHRDLKSLPGEGTSTPTTIDV
jgi:hypothetical protein